jgi:hypothetical protein
MTSGVIDLNIWAGWIERACEINEYAAPGGKLARYAKGTTKVEIRGQGHQVLAPGCPPACHSSGLTYEFESRGWM